MNKSGGVISGSRPSFGSHYALGKNSPEPDSENRLNADRQDDAGENSGALVNESYDTGIRGQNDRDREHGYGRDMPNPLEMSLVYLRESIDASFLH